MATQIKFGRAYSLLLESPRLPPGGITIQLPFTIEFDVQRNGYPANNVAMIRLYNLSQEHRWLLTHDRWDPGFTPRQTINVTLSAGYGPGPHWPVIFAGNTYRAWSVREGVNFITTLDCRDGGRAFNNAFSEKTFSAGQPFEQVIKELVEDLLPFGVSLGVISKAITQGRLAKGIAFSGNTAELLRELTNSNFFVDNLKANILAQTDAIGGEHVLINSDSGLLNTPMKEDSYLNFDILFEPRLIVGSLVNIQSVSTLPIYNGLHKVLRIHHKGMISDSVAGDAVTSLGVQSGVFVDIVAPAGVG